MIEKSEKELYDILNLLEIKYVRYEHKAIYTIEEAKGLDISIPGKSCKNLFLKNGKGTIHYIVILDEDKKVDLKLLSKQIQTKRLSFASEERLYKYLKLKAGSVSPFGIINDTLREVVVLIDSDLVNVELINFHPNINKVTIGISYLDFEKFIKWHKNKFYYVKI